MHCRVFGHFFQSLHERGRELVGRLQLCDLFELAGRRFLVPLDQVVVAEQELDGRRVRVAPDRGFKGTKLVGVGVHVWVKTDQGGPVQTGPGREHGVIDGCGLIETL